MEEAEAAWRRGEYARARRLLEPYATEDLGDPLEAQRMLSVLADATISDPTLDVAERREIASGYLGRLLDADPSWRVPPNIFSPDLYELFAQVRESQAAKEGAACRANLTVCQAELDIARTQYRQLEKEHEKLERDYAVQDVQRVQTVKRSRAFALIPLGVGHFYNNDVALGATFLSLELAFGAAGLGLLIQRVAVDGCRRTRGFGKGSLKCDDRPGVTDDDIVNRRKAEEVMGWFFIGTMVLDVVVAQIRFRAEEVTKVETVPRSQLQLPESTGEGGKGSREQRRRRPRRAKVRPTPAFVPGGGGAGLEVRF